MKKIIITEKPDDFKFCNDSCEIIDVNKVQNVIPNAWKNYSDEYVPYLICEGIKDNKSFIVIDFEINKQHLFLLAHHLITSSKGIICFLSETQNLLSPYENDFGLFLNRAIKLINKGQLSELLDKSDVSELERFCNVFELNFDYINYVSNYQKFLVLDRHQATNEWGAIKLLLNYGISLQKIEQSYQIPKTIFFKQKLKEHGVEDSTIIHFNGYVHESKIGIEKTKLTSNISKLQKILLIDDNANKGWKFALEKIFYPANIDVKLNLTDALLVSDFSIYDFIFLDLRLPADLLTTSSVDISNGIQLINKIKSDEKSLHVPLLIFTASQKASTLNQILEAGADGMYVKESTDSSKEESFDNYLDFLIETNFLIEKSEYLRLYWDAILKIKTSLLPEITDNPPLIIQSRIIERLEMFYGLIKTKFEQSDFNTQKFHYSYDTLSFMTLWSILNEIQECFFEKNLEMSHTSFLDASGTHVYLPLDSWKIKNQSPDKFFIKDKPIFEEEINERGRRSSPNLNKVRREIYSSFQRKNVAPFFEFDRNGFKLKRENYRDRLSLQIAFFLLAKDALKLSSRVNNYLQILQDSNKIRNTLYITHGENSNTGFHSLLEKDKHIASNVSLDLFKLISFLLTGNDSII
ncbi:response regulator [[Flexibacter] sp. ATCC 35103]|uniref:response regulator n=1 Tax=[Flexibacter] sp. ATCC 35103 TaxID=1937528 RepID=UPI0009D4032F|nr:response regulator [[Flexibacter] sp. ATCC 35103]OMQ13676.1 hypothetical protein BXU01_04165 [[Flexibacter] sp. ATCC 35103]